MTRVTDDRLALATGGTTPLSSCRSVCAGTGTPSQATAAAAAAVP